MDDTATPKLVVGVGASAGGLEAFKMLLKALPSDTGMAFLLVQHLDPNHDSLLSELLVPHTGMAVRDARQGDPLAPDTVHVISPGCALAVRRGCVELSEPTLHRGVRLPVDHLFRSLAREYGSRSVGIVLSGAGSDGSSGLRDIKSAGGLTIAQDPDSGGQSGMPQSAVNTGMVDLVLAIEEMPAALARFATLPATARFEPALEMAASDGEEADDGTDTDDGPTLQLDDKDLARLTALLETRNDFDLRVYKKATVERRVLRRMLLSGFENIGPYFDHLRERLGEQQILVRDLLISVTSFFRDPEVFETLDERVLRPLIDRRESGAEVRVWVAGCATGEEAYSIGMALLDTANALDKRIDLQIFATDVDQEALAVARAGVYPVTVAEQISETRLNEYFSPLEGRGYKVRSVLRDRISFAAHDLTKDPPFSRMDLVSCRNVLIYLTNDAQAHVLALLHFALQPDGHLLLSTSESTGSRRELFATVSKPARLYHKVGQSRAVAVQRSRSRAVLAAGEEMPGGTDDPRTGGGGGRRVPDPARRAVLEACVPPTVVVNGDGAVVFMHGELGPYLRFPQGDRPQLELGEMLRPDLATRIRSALYRCRRGGQETLAQSSPDDGRETRVRIIARPAPTLGDGAVVMSFEESVAPSGESAARAQTLDAIEAAAGQETVIDQLENELKATREDLRNTVEELESSNEELRSSNEESMSMNEELQSANEELEATTEELRSLNEELTTVNAQLREKVEQLEQAHDDLGNFFASARVPMIFLDERLRINRFTPAAAELLDIDSGDIGRFTGDIARELLQQDLEREARDVLDDLTTKTQELRAGDGRWFSRRILPYRTESRRIEGVVVTLVDITELKRASQRLALRGRQQAIIARLGIDALHESDLERFLERAVRDVQSTLDLDHCKILELQPGGKALLLRVGVGWNDGLAGHATVPSGVDSQAGFTLQTREPVVVDDLETESRFSGPDLLLEHGVTSGLSCAVREGTREYGVLGGHTRDQRDFSSEDATFFQAVANVIGSAVSRSQANAGALLESGATRALVAHTDPDDALNDVLSRLVGAIDADVGELWWSDGETLVRRHLHVSRPERDVDVERRLAGEGADGSGNAFVDRVVGARQALWSTELGDPPLFADDPDAGSLGLVSALGLPLVSDDRTLGVVTLYSRARLFADDALLRTLDRIGAMVGERIARIGLEQRAARLAAITASSQDAIVGQDHEGRVTEWLPGAERLFGYTAAEMLDRSPERLLPPELRESARAVIARVLAGESVEPFETARLTSGGERVEVSVRASPILDRDGRIVGVSSTDRDITRLKETERRLLAADQEKDKFLAMLGHELRNPLSSIRTAAELLKLDGDETDRQRAQVVLERQSAHMARLLDGLLDVSRIISDKIALERDIVDLAGICREVIADAAERIEGKTLTLTVVPPDADVTIDGDRVRLVQIIDNLLSNSIKYTLPGGTITVTLERTRHEARLDVGDDGVGIHTDLLPHVFEVFRQSSQSIDRSAGGLGLALARSLVELHGGTIEAHSDGEGQGARFVVRLPLVVDATASAPERRDLPHATLDVLVVEDNADSADLLRRVLERFGHTVRITGNGREALDETARKAPEVVLCDLGLPDGMSGHDVARALRDDPATRDVRLIALTGYGRAEDRARSLEAGFDHHLTKPIGIDELKRALSLKRTDGERVADPRPA